MRTPFLFFVLVISGLMIASCRKGELPSAYYYGKVSVSLIALPNTPDIEMRLGGKNLNDVIVPGSSRSFTLLSQAGKLEIFKANTDTLIADTLINILPNTTQNFRFAYSEDAGITGFIGNATVASDSVAIQFMQNLDQQYFPYEALDLYIIFVNPVTGNLDETGIVVKGLTKGKLNSQIIALPLNDTTGQPITYGAKLKDAATGETINFPGTPDPYVFGLPIDPGKFYIISLKDDGFGGINPEVINL